jgi:Protein of unknown function (DUF2934)
LSIRVGNMSNELHQMTQDLQTRIRELAYLMWESAGRQQGMAMEYWLKAESEVLSTLQAAATSMLPGTRSAKTAKTEARPVPSATPAIAGKPAPVAAAAPPVRPAPVAPAAPAAPVTAAAAAATKAAARPAIKATPAESRSPAEKPAANKAARRGKAKT